MKVRMLVDEVPFVCMANRIYLRALPEALPASIAEVACECNMLAEVACPSHPGSHRPLQIFELLPPSTERTKSLQYNTICHDVNQPLLQLLL